MLAGQTTQETGERPGAMLVNNERTCSRCRHWDLEHVQRLELDDEAKKRAVELLHVPYRKP